MIRFLLGATLVALTLRDIQGQCIDSEFTLDNVEGECGFLSLSNSFQEFFDDDFNTYANCPNSANEELLQLLDATSLDEAGVKVQSICGQAYDSFDKFAFENIPGPAYPDGRSFIEQFYGGGTDWNEQVETIDKETEERSNYLKEDALNVYLHYAYKEGSYGITEFPDYLHSLADCELNSIYCCWPQDRQAKDGNGNCKTPYDIDCVDKDPADNTDLCYVDLVEGQDASGYNSTTEGHAVFPLDDRNTRDNRGEGPVHCPGFAWANDPADISSVFKGNNLFYVSMYDHMLRRGYVRNIEGAPMCGCSEYMPTVSRADCTEIEIDKMTVSYSFQDGSFRATIKHIAVDFNSCQGKDRYGRNDSNDLWSYMNRLYMEGKLEASKLVGITQKLVGDDANMCRQAENKFTASKGYVRGFRFDEAEWTILAGREAFAVESFYGKHGADYLISGGQMSTLAQDVSAPSTARIIRRLCATCHDTHQDIFYRRLTPTGELDLLHNLMYSRQKTPDNIWGVDFQLYSSLEDAQADRNPWNCSPYKYSDGFPGDCGPYGLVSNQESLFQYHHVQTDTAFLVQSSPLVQLHQLPSTNVGYNYLPGAVYSDTDPSGVGEKLYMTASGRDIWGRNDEFNSMFQPNGSGNDSTLKVKVDSLVFDNSWAKAGLMIRTSMEAGATYFAVLLTGRNGLVIQYRKAASHGSYSRGSTSGLQLNSTWLMLTKRIDKYTGYSSDDGLVWEPIYQTMALSLNDNTSPAQWYSGLVMTSHQSKTLAEATFSNFENDLYYWPSSAPSSSPAPTLEIVTSMDVGDVSSSFPGSVYHAENTDRWEIQASGRGISGTYDRGFHFEHTQYSGDASVVAYLAKVDYSDYWAKGGVMIRDSVERGSKYASVLVVAGRGIVMQVRNETNGGTYLHYGDTWEWGTDSYIRSGWLKIVRNGNVMSGFKSQNGTDWTLIYTEDVPFVNDIYEMGLACTSNKNNNYTTCSFKDLQATSGSGGEVTDEGLISEDVGRVDSVNFPGMVAYDENLNTWDIRASGADIWGRNSDGFHFVYYGRQSGNVSLVAYLESVDYSDKWAKAGLMIRDSLDRGSKNVFVMVSPEYGIRMQVRNETNGNTKENYGSNWNWGSDRYIRSGWLKIEKTGNLFSGFKSSDGTNWVLIHSQLVVFDTNAFEIGMAVTSRTLNNYTKGVFSNFSVA